MNGFYPMKRWFLPLFLFTVIIFCGPNPSQAQPDGAALFNSNCKACHSAGDNVVVGPGLKGIEARRNMKWIIDWVHNSQAMVKSGDAYAVEIFKKFNQSPMTAFPNLKDEEIVAIIDYVKAEAAKAPAPAASAAVATTDSQQSQQGISWIWVGVLLILIILVSVLGRIKKGLEAALRTKHGLPHPAPLTREREIKNWIRGNKKLIAIGLIVLFAVGSWKGWYALAAVGINQDYEPEQPIKFSHKLHVGQNGINCVYCHSGAEKGRHANIPSANVCMNCHKYVQEGPKYGKTEIAKIYKALDFDQGTQQYGTNPKPIQWTQVHNLPDLAYFNHSQHVSVGKIDCQTCHGPVQEMDVVKQFSPLTMGWCIDCHRKTEVKMDGNGYYTELHKKMQAEFGPESKITVDKIGGLECARCHY